MLFKLIDEILELISTGIVFFVLFIVFIVIIGFAYYYAPIITCVFLGLILFGFILSIIDLSDAQTEKLGMYIAYLIFATTIGFGIYLFPKTALVIASLIGFGYIIELRNANKLTLQLSSIKEAFKRGFKNGYK